MENGACSAGFATREPKKPIYSAELQDGYFQGCTRRPCKGNFYCSQHRPLKQRQAADCHITKHRKAARRRSTCQKILQNGTNIGALLVFTPHIFINCYDPDRVNTRNFWVARLLCKVPGKCLCQILALSPCHKICGKMHASNHCLWVKQKPLLYAIVFHLNLVACGMEKLSQAIFPKQAGIKESPPIGIEKRAYIQVQKSNYLPLYATSLPANYG